jgi:glycosyltransferase involved in cell wall biosynthesis
MTPPEPDRVPTAAGGPGSAPPRVTVAIPTWNRAHLVKRALTSVLAQTFTDIEILVVDDGSTNTTPEVLASVDDRRLRTIRLARNGGISRVRNTAIQLARGDWVAFLDDDNEWAPEYLQRQLALAASRPDADMVYCRAQRRDGRTGRVGLAPSAVWNGKVFRRLVDGWLPLVSCALLRRSALIDAGGLDEGLRACEDHDLWLRLAQRTHFAGTAEVLVVRHEHAGAHLSRNYQALVRDAAVLDRKWKAAITRSCGRVAYWTWRAGLVTNAELGRAIQAAESRERLEGLRSIGRMARCLPWSTPGVARGLAVTLLGATTYRRFTSTLRSWLTVRTRVSG